MSDRATLAAYDSAAGAYAQDWHDQPPPTDLHDIVRRYFKPGTPTAEQPKPRPVPVAGTFRLLVLGR